MTAHKHKEAIIHWANGGEIEFRASMAIDWLPAGAPSWLDHYEYRIKPVAPKVASTMSTTQLHQAWYNTADLPPLPLFEHKYARRCADAAIAHALESQQVVLMSEVQETARNLAKHSDEINGAMRDLKVANAVVFAANEFFNKRSIIFDLHQIIDSVK